MSNDPNTPDGALAQLRAEMDAINERLCLALDARAALCRRIAAHKRAHGLPAVDRVREEQMLLALLAAHPDGYPRADLAAILGAVFTASRGLVEDPSRR